MTGSIQPRLVLATRNQHKIRELRALLDGAVPGLDVATQVVGADRWPQLEDVAETGTTFAENALLKARALTAATGLPSVADDSGLCVDVLGGSPGIFSARWCGRHGDDEANLALLLAQLGDVPDAHRGAHFSCVAALVTPTGFEHVTRGRLRGVLEHVPRGHGGFGYDSVLRPDGGRRTCAELSPGEKNAISHRGQALRAMLPVLAELLG